MVMRPDISSRWACQAHGLTYFRPPQASAVSRAFSAERKLKAAGDGAEAPPLARNSAWDMQISTPGSPGSFSAAMVYSLPSASVHVPQRQQISFSSGGTSEEELLEREEGGVSELLELLLESPCAVTVTEYLHTDWLYSLCGMSMFWCVMERVYVPSDNSKEPDLDHSWWPPSSPGSSAAEVRSSSNVPPGPEMVSLPQSSTVRLATAVAPPSGTVKVSLTGDMKTSAPADV